MTEANIIKFPNTKRRVTIAKMTRGYSGLIAKVMQSVLLDDGSECPETGEPMAREMDRTEIRHSAVISVSEYFMSYIKARVQFEDPIKFYRNPKNPDGLWKYHFEVRNRVQNYQKDKIGVGRLIVDPKANARLGCAERDYFNNVFTALKLEAQADIEFDECQFWADVFRGFADADPSGVVLRAAGLVLLDHLDDFARALAFHR